MKERPIIFSGAMVRAILDARKTQTRRVVKPAKDRNGSGCELAPCEIAGEINAGDYILCPYGEPGDRLWVRETWNITHETDLAPGERIGKSAASCVASNRGFACACADGVVYRADGVTHHPEHGKALWRSPIHMPRWASRITLEVTAVRVERLQDISSRDEDLEGIGFCMEDPDTAAGRAFGEAEHYAIAGVPMRHSPERWGLIAHFQSLGMDWLANPWVWVVEFSVIDTPPQEGA